MPKDELLAVDGDRHATVLRLRRPPRRLWTVRATSTPSVIARLRTAENRFVAPAPRTALEIVCVVETGKPKYAVNQRIVAVALSAAKPSSGWSLWPDSLRSVRLL